MKVLLFGAFDNEKVVLDDEEPTHIVPCGDDTFLVCCNNGVIQLFSSGEESLTTPLLTFHTKHSPVLSFLHIRSNDTLVTIEPETSNSQINIVRVYYSWRKMSDSNKITFFELPCRTTITSSIAGCQTTGRLAIATANVVSIWSPIGSLDSAKYEKVVQFDHCRNVQKIAISGNYLSYATDHSVSVIEVLSATTTVSCSLNQQKQQQNHENLYQNRLMFGDKTIPLALDAVSDRLRTSPRTTEDFVSKFEKLTNSEDETFTIFGPLAEIYQNVRIEHILSNNSLHLLLHAQYKSSSGAIHSLFFVPGNELRVFASTKTEGFLYKLNHQPGLLSEYKYTNDTVQCSANTSVLFAATSSAQSGIETFKLLNSGSQIADKTVPQVSCLFKTQPFFGPRSIVVTDAHLLLIPNVWGRIILCYKLRENGSSICEDWNHFETALLNSIISENHTPQTRPESAFLEMLQSDFHLLSSDDPSLTSIWIPPPSQQQQQVTTFLKWSKVALQSFISTMHLVYEDSKLCLLLGQSRKQLAKLLVKLCAVVGWKYHSDHYFRDFPAFSSLSLSNTPNCSDEPNCPSIYSWLLLKLSGESPEPILPEKPVKVLKTLETICKLYDLLCKTGPHPPSPLEIVLKMADEGITTETLDTIPFGISLPLKEACIKCRNSSLPISETSKNQTFLKLIGRTDLLAQRKSKGSNDEYNEELLLALFQSKMTPIPTPPRPPPEVGGVSSRFLQLQQRALGLIAPPSSTTTATSQQTDALPKIRNGTECDDQVVSILFSTDKRIQEVQNLLQWTERAVIPVEETTGTEWVAEQQSILAKLSHRTLSLPVGRGAFVLSLDRTASTDNSGSAVQEVFPPLQLDGKNLSGHDVRYEQKPPMNSLSWPNFHNGVATALRHGAGLLNTTNRRAWLSHTPDENDRDTYAGFLFGLGLQGLLPSNPTGRLVELLYSSKSPLEGVSLLLGLAAENMGTMNESVFKTLSVHIPFLRPTPSSTTTSGIEQSTAIAADSVEIPIPTVTAALVGLGLLFRGTGHRRTVEVLLEELSTQPSARALSDRESYALSSGLGLGLVSLGCGDSIPGVEDLHLVDTLTKLIKGGPEEEQRKEELKQESAAAAQAQRPSLFLTNGWVDTNVTAPGAILALGLMFFGTNSNSVQRVLRIPQTSVELAAVRPDHILLRELALCLVSWNSIQPKAEWIESQIPRFMIQLVSSAERVVSPRLKMYHLAVIAGACLAIGLRFAGTNNQEARDLLLSQLHDLISMQLPTFSVSDRILRASREVFIDNLCIAVSLVVAGTGNVEVLKCLRSLRVKAGASANEGAFGHHMARHMALGFLFLGGGLLTFSNSKEAISSLVCALFPQWPASSSDCSCHLQALRHLYVLAVECRLVVACDVDSHRPCLVPLQISLKKQQQSAQQKLTLMSPTTLPFALDEIALVEVESPRYFSVQLSTEQETGLSLIRAGPSSRSCPFVVFVKRKAGFLPYSEDPKGQRSVFNELLPFSQSLVSALTATATSSEPTSQNKSENFSAIAIQQFSNDPVTLAFVEYLCTTIDSNDLFAKFCFNALLQCVAVPDKIELLPVYLSLYNAAFSCGTAAIEEIYNAGLVFGTAKNRLHNTLLSKSLLEVIEDKFQQFIYGKSEIMQQLQMYIKYGTLPENPRMLFGVVALLGIPDAHCLGRIREIMKTPEDLSTKTEKIVKSLSGKTTLHSILTLKMQNLF